MKIVSTASFVSCDLYSVDVWPWLLWCFCINVHTVRFPLCFCASDCFSVLVKNLSFLIHHMYQESLFTQPPRATDSTNWTGSRVLMYINQHEAFEDCIHFLCVALEDAVQWGNTWHIAAIVCLYCSDQNVGSVSGDLVLIFRLLTFLCYTLVKHSSCSLSWYQKCKIVK